MEEIHQHKYTCKICSKTCVSGKSLGGHMRLHLAEISASKKMKIEDDDSNYQLRNNPKKSWRVSDPLVKKQSSCAECGKGFSSPRALSGHMRSHSAKTDAHLCPQCGRGFHSIRAMFGHMKSHSKKSRLIRNESSDSLSDLESLCPVRRKRSRIGYKTASDSDIGNAEEAATCLLLLSRGVRAEEELYGSEANGESSGKEYECVVCMKVFSSGQALGGHKRAHFVETKKKELGGEMQDVLDLNFPAAVEEDDVGFDCTKMWSLSESCIL